MKKLCGFMVVACFSLMNIGQGYAQEALQPLTLQLNWITDVEFAGLLLAKERGWYEEAGIDLTIVPYNFKDSPTKEVLEGRAQIGVAEGDSLIKARAGGAAVKAFAAQFQKSPLCFVSKKDRGWETPADLKGKRVGITHPGTQRMLHILLNSQGMTVEDVETRKIGFDFEPFLNDEIDFQPGYMNAEAIDLQEQGLELNIIPAFKYGYEFYSAAFFTTETMMQEQPEFIQKFLDVSWRGWQAAYQDLPAAAQLVIEKYYDRGNVEQQTKSLRIFQTLATLGEGKKFLGWMDVQTWQKGVESLREIEQIEQNISAVDLFTMDFLRTLYFGQSQ